MKSKYISIIIVTLLLLAVITYFAISQEKTTLLIIGTEAPPHTFTENEGYSGITIELAEIIFSKLGMPYEIELIPWGDAINKMKNKEADVIMDAIPTEERMKFLNIDEDELYFNSKDGIDTRWSEGVGVAYLKNSEIEINSEEDLLKKDYRVGIISGYFYVGLDMSKYNIYSYDDPERLLEGVDKKEVEIAIIPTIEGAGAIKNLGLTTVEISKPLFKSHYLKHFSFSNLRNKKRLNKIKEQVEQEITILKESGEYNKIYNKYLEEFQI